MKMPSLNTKPVVLGCLLSVCILFAAVTYAAEQGAAATPAKSVSASTLSPAQKEKWTQMQNLAGKDYQLCTEHCGNDTPCHEKCHKTHQNRLDRDYQRLLTE